MHVQKVLKQFVLLGEIILVKAHENLTTAHNLQTKLLQDEVKGQGQSC